MDTYNDYKLSERLIERFKTRRGMRSSYLTVMMPTTQRALQRLTFTAENSIISILLSLMVSPEHPLVSSQRVIMWLKASKMVCPFSRYSKTNPFVIAQTKSTVTQCFFILSKIFII